MRNTISTAIIGCGRIAGGYDRQIPSEWSATHAGAYHLCPETKLVAVADTDPVVLKQFQDKWGVDAGYTDYRELLAKEKIDILSICLPTEYHLQAFQSAVHSGVSAVFFEKPLSNDLSEAVEIEKLGRGHIVSLNYFRRWNPTLAKLAEELREGKRGKVVSAVVRYSKGMLVNASHFVDMARWFWGEPIGMDFLRKATNDPVDPGVDFVLSFPKGEAVYFLNVPDIDYVFADVDIVTTKGRVAISQRGQKLLDYSLVDEPFYQLFEVLGDPAETETEWRNCSTRAVQEIVEILNGKVERPACGLMDGLRTLEICDAIRQQMGS